MIGLSARGSQHRQRREAQIESRNAIEDERAARAAEFEAEEALFATMSVGSPRRSGSEEGTQKLDPKVAAQLEAFSGRMELVESVMKRHNFTLEEALQALEDFGA